MRLGLYQFAAGADIARNEAAILRGVAAARAAGVGLLVFQECATCGYPRVETFADAALIDEAATRRCEARAREAAADAGLYLALGTIRREGEARFNSLLISGPDGRVMGHYDKRALWGSDWDIFTRGTSPGVFDIDGVRVGFRICFEVRFPEYFRELYVQRAQLCCISLCDVAATPDAQHMDTIRAHLLTRAVENLMPVAAVNSVSQRQTAPTAVFDADGAMVCMAPVDEEALLTYEYAPPVINFGLCGRKRNVDLIVEEDGR